MTKIQLAHLSLGGNSRKARQGKNNYEILYMANATILMCTYNGQQYVEQQLESFSSQINSNFHLYISDDGSSDDTLEILTRFRGPDGQAARIRSGPQQGFAANFLSLLCAEDLAPGWVALSDQDDVWFPDKLSRAMDQLRDLDPERPALACGRTMLTDGALAPLGPSRQHRHFSFRNALVQNVVAGNTIVLNPAAHALIRRAGVVDVPYHDWWCYLLVSGAGGQIAYDPDPCMYYRQHGQNVLGENRSVRAVLRRAGSFGSQTWRRWFETNMAALLTCRDLLSPEHRKLVDAYARHPRTSAVSRTRALMALRPYRQRPYETAALYGGSLLGLA